MSIDRQLITQSHEARGLHCLAERQNPPPRDREPGTVLSVPACSLQNRRLYSGQASQVFDPRPPGRPKIPVLFAPEQLQLRRRHHVQKIAEHAITCLINLTAEKDVLEKVATDDRFLEILLGLLVVCVSVLSTYDAHATTTNRCDLFFSIGPR